MIAACDKLRQKLSWKELHKQRRGKMNMTPDQYYPKYISFLSPVKQF
jgi:hypothetical protein